MRSWVLVDGIEMSHLYPETFEVPSEEEKRKLKPGDVVKLGFELKEAPGMGSLGERMWVQILDVSGTAFQAKVKNTPVVLKDLKLGDNVAFESRHILAIE